MSESFKHISYTPAHYTTSDGKRFLNSGEAEKHQNALLKICPECQGKGYFTENDGHDCWGNFETVEITCKPCCGTGKYDKDRAERYAKYLEMSREFS